MNWGKTFANIGQGVTPFVSAFSAYGQYKTAKKSNQLEEKRLNNDLMLQKRAIGKENKMQANLDNSFASIYGPPKKKKKKNTLLNTQGEV